MLAVYGEHSASFLEALTHGEQPWQTARGDTPASSRSRREIPLSDIRVFYRELYDRRGTPGAKIDSHRCAPNSWKQG